MMLGIMRGSRMLTHPPLAVQEADASQMHRLIDSREAESRGYYSIADQVFGYGTKASLCFLFDQLPGSQQVLLKL